MPPDPVPHRDLAQLELLASAEGVAVFDTRYRLAAWNRPLVELGLVPDRVHAGLPILDVYRHAARRGLLGPGDPEAIARRRLDEVRAGRSPTAEDLQATDGRILEARRYFMPGVGVVAVFADVTEERRARERTRRAETLRQLGRVAGGLAHDFNNLLTVIITNLEVTLSDSADSDDSIRVALAAATRGAGLAHTALDVMRRQPEQVSTVGVDGLLAEVVRFVDRLLPENIETFAQLRDGGAAVRVDRSRFATAILNLALNARDAMPAGGRLEIRSAREGGEIHITVADSGHGMCDETLRRASEPFFTTKENEQGTGLGLHEVKRFAAAADGRIEITSTPAIGTEVKLRLPVCSTSPASAAADAPAAEAAHVLLVDDDDLVRQSVGQLLHTASIEVDTAASAGEAEAKLRKHSYDALVTDTALGGEERGLELVRRARQLRTGLPVLLCSSDPRGEHPALPSDQGPPTAVLAKPFSGTQIREALTALMH